MGARHHALPDQIDCLPVAQDGDAVGVREVVGNRNGLDRVGLVAIVVAYHPLAAHARAPGDALGLAVSEVQARLDRDVMRLAPRWQRVAGGPGFERGVFDFPCHEIPPIWDTLDTPENALNRNAGNRRVQHMDNIQVWTRINKHVPLYHDHRDLLGKLEQACTPVHGT
jgi:hypothetical protein